jgi:FHS family L-fucose permease-like MFS transporter
MANSKSFALPLAFIGIMFFAIGFALGINSVLVPVLQGGLSITSAESYLLIAATFIPFLIFGYPAGLTIKAIGYKRTMALSFAIFAVAFYLFVMSANNMSFSLFLLASFVSGAANAYLQASVNPYITILGPIESAAKRISIMGICNKLAWPIPPLFLALLIGKDVKNIGIADLTTPFYVIIIAFVILGVMALMAPLPARTKAIRRLALMLTVKHPYGNSPICCWDAWHCFFTLVLKQFLWERWLTMQPH